MDLHHPWPLKGGIRELLSAANRERARACHVMIKVVLSSSQVL